MYGTNAWNCSTIVRENKPSTSVLSSFSCNLLKSSIDEYQPHNSANAEGPVQPHSHKMGWRLQQRQPLRFHLSPRCTGVGLNLFSGMSATSKLSFSRETIITWSMVSNAAAIWKSTVRWSRTQSKLSHCWLWVKQSLCCDVCAKQIAFSHACHSLEDD